MKKEFKNLNIIGNVDENGYPKTRIIIDGEDYSKECEGIYFSCNPCAHKDKIVDLEIKTRIEFSPER